MHIESFRTPEGRCEPRENPENRYTSPPRDVRQLANVPPLAYIDRRFGVAPLAQAAATASRGDRHEKASRLSNSDEVLFGARARSARESLPPLERFPSKKREAGQRRGGFKDPPAGAAVQSGRYLPDFSWAAVAEAAASAASPCSDAASFFGKKRRSPLGLAAFSACAASNFA